MTVEEWNAEGCRLFGGNKMDWSFVCPCCGHVASTRDYEAAGAPSTAVAFSCVGRWTEKPRGAFEKGPGPCDYAGGGLIGLNPVEVGDNGRVFAFAEVAGS